MLEYIQFYQSLSASSFEYINVEVICKDGILKISAFTSFTGEEIISRKFTYNQSYLLLKMIDDLKIIKWKKKYKADSDEQKNSWKMIYKQYNEKSKIFTGENDFPPNWEEFISLIYKLIELTQKNTLKNIQLEFRQISAFLPGENNDIQFSFLPYNYIEKVTLDYDSDCFIFSITIDDEVYLKNTYHIPTEVKELIDELSQDIHNMLQFDPAYNNPPKIMENLPTYTLKATYQDKEEYKINGFYIAEYLPPQWKEFIDTIFEFIILYGVTGAMFSPKIYTKSINPINYIFCSVKFEQSSKSYYYKTENPCICIGDYVYAPVKSSNNLLKGKVVNIEIFNQYNLPYSLDKVKTLAGKIPLLTNKEVDDLIEKNKQVHLKPSFLKNVKRKIIKNNIQEARFYKDLEIFAHDCNLDSSKIGNFKKNKIIYKRESFLASESVGGMCTPCRFIILSNHSPKRVTDKNTNAGICVFKENSFLKVIDNFQIDNKTIIVLLHIVPSEVKYFKHKDQIVENYISKKIKIYAQDKMSVPVVDSLKEYIDDGLFTGFFDIW